MFNKVTIIGLGLIGSSIARAIKKNNLCKILVAHDKSKIVLKKTLKLKITNYIEPNLKKSVENSDLVIICTPLGTYKNIVSVIKNYLKKTCILTDVGSAKIFVTNTVNKLINKNTIWIPAHPVAGTEQSGNFLSSARSPSLFQWIHHLFARLFASQPEQKYQSKSAHLDIF